MPKKILNEPSYKFPLTKIDVIKTLNWYNENVDYSDAIEFASNYVYKHYNVNISNILGKEHSTFGYVCRMFDNGLILSDDNVKWHNKKIEELIHLHLSNKPKREYIKKAIKSSDNSNNILSDIDEALDQFIINKCSKSKIPDSLNQITRSKYDSVIIFCKEKIAEFEKIFHNEELREGYSNFTDSNIKNIIKFFKSIIEFCDTSISKNKITRIKKQTNKNLGRILDKIKYCKVYSELNLESINPLKIMEAKVLWIYNSKYKKLGKYVAKDNSGLILRNSIVENYDESLSICKTVRNPKEILPKIISGGKIYLRTALDNLTTKSQDISNRLTNETILLRVE